MDPKQQDIVRGPHKWDPEKKLYVAAGPVAAHAPLTVSAQLAAILRGPHKFIPGEGGNPGQYVAVAAPAPVAPERPRAPGPVAGQPIRQQPKQ